MTNKFVFTKKVVNRVIDGDGPQLCYMSVDPGEYNSDIKLVIGAAWSNKCACTFNKSGVKELIDILTDIHEAMED